VSEWLPGLPSEACVCDVLVDGLYFFKQARYRGLGADGSGLFDVPAIGGRRRMGAAPESVQHRNVSEVNAHLRYSEGPEGVQSDG